MFALTIDQIDSRHHADRVEAGVRAIAERFGARLAAEPERTAGDEFQLATAHGDVALEAALLLVRAGDWSVGLGIGDVRPPLGDSVRAMTGSAFVNARAAVDAAKRRPARFALVAGPPRPGAPRPGAAGLDPLIRLLLALRERRTAEGWELFDLLEGEESTLTAAAGRLGISVQAASQRALAAGIRLDGEAREALASMLDAADERIGS